MAIYTTYVYIYRESEKEMEGGGEEDEGRVRVTGGGNRVCRIMVDYEAPSTWLITLSILPLDLIQVCDLLTSYLFT